MSRKVFISVLGTGFYNKCTYSKDDFKSTETRYIQQAMLEYYHVKDWDSNDVVCIMLTDAAKEKNWENEKNTRQRNNSSLPEEYISLHDEIKNMHLPAKICGECIKNGMTDNEIWDIFNSVYGLLEPNDELYLDLTHGYRYLPMLMLVLSNYAKFLKGIKVNAVSYGNFEAIDRETNIAPIVDLLPLNQLQDWTIAASEFQKFGETESLVKLGKNEVIPLLTESKGKDENAKNLRALIESLEFFMNDVRLCRGMNLYNAESYKKITYYLNEISETIIKPLNPLIEEIKKSISDFKEEKGYKNLLTAAKWNCDKGNYQASITELQEGIVTLLCERNDIDIYDESEREIINKAFIKKYAANTTLKKRYSMTYKPCTDTKKEEKIDNIIREESLFNNSELINTFVGLTELRNDLNHSGMRSKRRPTESKEISSKIKKAITGIHQILEF